MNNARIAFTALAAGGLLGAVFFGGLWWTVRNGVTAAHPALWFPVSLLLRTGIALTGFYLVSANNWWNLLLCLVGFQLARTVVTRLIQSAAEARHAP